MLRAGFGPSGLRTLYVLGVLSAVKAAALVLLAGSLARGIVSVIAGDDVWRDALLVAVAAALLRALASWATGAYAARATLGAKEAIRRDLADRLVQGGGGSGGGTTTLATRGLDELDKYFGTVLPAITNVAVVPLMVGVMILSADWVSALIIVLTVPLVPVFMALIGMQTQDDVDAASVALGRLSDHLVELARGLPVLVGLGRVEEQTAALDRISNDYRVRTMATLRTAFLSSLALELISTISVAVVAVFIGTRLVNGTLPLEVGLLVLILAPECFAPFRDLGAAFHASRDGVLALDQARALIDAPVPVSPVAAADTIAVRGLTVLYEGRGGPAVDHVRFELPEGQITAITGASGSGKSTILAVLAGVLGDGEDAAIAGTVAGVDRARVAWVPQHPHTVGDTVRAELRLYGGAAATEQSIDAVLRQLGIDLVADSDPAQLSPGELRRVGIARALLRVDDGAVLVLLDEPTAHLDDETSLVIERAISGLRGRATVVVASHEASVTALASHVVRLGAATPGRRNERGPVSAGSLAEAVASPDGSRPPVDPPTGAHPSTLGEESDRVAVPGTLRLLREVLTPAAGRFALAILLGTLAALFAVALTAVSGWLIVRASTQPPIMYLLVAIVGVRFFGIGRSVLRYGERLVTHDAIFVAVTGLRTRLWRSLAAQGATSRKMMRGGTALDYLVVTADQVRDLAPRVLVPPIVGVAVGLASVVAVGLLHAPALPLLLACLVVCLIIAPAVALAADRAASRGQQAIRSTVTRRFAAMIAARAELRANGVDAQVRAELRDLDTNAGETARRSAWALGLGGAVLIAASCSTAAGMLAVSAPAVRAGTLPIEVVAVLVLLPLALLDPLLSVVDAVQQWPSLRQALRRAARLTAARELPGSQTPFAQTRLATTALADVVELELRAVAARWPHAPVRAFHGVSATVETGEWLVVSGASGSGKSTLLTLLLGYLAPDAGSYLLGGRDSRRIDPRELRRHVSWCPQEGHLFDSTVRANLLIARARTDAPDESEMLLALRRAGLGGVVGRLPLGLDTRIGSEGAHLSGGERQRLAVARTLLTRAEVVLLDEPTAHLDAETASTLMDDLRAALSGQIVVLVTHHLVDRQLDDQRVDLDRLALPAALV
ncbi:thiol reductant ABC exporter subunit CydD [Marisediminicola antarctica]|uniref:ABC transporter ATP-binding protein n=1 Tax=Marisediminicola antarctica TaxID=674079 RepID=A0A7L5AGU5_9MICO|nr:thiol reductant ABC exporter subunit CydD [Marisediminicola antarctica]QHO69236.1 ABC transporter ATP-binding protein [Marisediminicola antarctica]